MKAIAVLLTRVYTDPDFAKRIAQDLLFHSVSYRQGMFLARKMSQYRPRTVVEVGFGYGVSALWIQQADTPPKRHIIVDPDLKSRDRNSPLYMCLTKRTGVRFEGGMTSQEFLAGMLRNKQKADMIFIDGSELFDSVMTDLYFATKILNTHGIVIIRNLWNTPVRKAVLFYLKNLPYVAEDCPPFSRWVMRHVPMGGEIVFRLFHRRMDLCVLRITGRDDRPWKHYNPF